MQILITPDNHIHVGPNLTAFVEATLQDTLSRFDPQITRVEVHLSDTNSHKKGEVDKRCALEARLAGLPPVGVKQDAGNLEEAIEGAAEKLQRLLDSQLGRLDRRKGSTSMAGDEQL